MSEHHEQSLTVKWARLNEARWPELRTLFAVPNAAKRSKAVAGRLKAEGMVAGVPDLALPIARCGYHALFIEMKQETLTVPNPAFATLTLRRTYPTPAQRAWHQLLREYGNAVVVCWNAEEAESVIEAYLKGEFTEEDAA